MPPRVRLHRTAPLDADLAVPGCGGRAYADDQKKGDDGDQDG